MQTNAEEVLTESDKDMFIKLLMEELEVLKTRLAAFEVERQNQPAVSVIAEAEPDEECSKVTAIPIEHQDIAEQASPKADQHLDYPQLLRKKTLKEIFSTGGSANQPEDKKDIQSSMPVLEGTDPTQNPNDSEANMSQSVVRIENPATDSSQLLEREAMTGKHQISELLKLNLSKLVQVRRERSAVRETKDGETQEGLQLPKVGGFTQVFACPEDVDGSNPYGLGVLDSQPTGVYLASSQRSSKDPGSSRRSSREYGRYQKRVKQKVSVERSSTQKFSESTDRSITSGQKPIARHRGSLQDSSRLPVWENSGLRGMQRANTQQEDGTSQIQSSMRFTVPEGLGDAEDIEKSYQDTSLIQGNRGVIGHAEEFGESSLQRISENEALEEIEKLRTFETFNREAEVLDSCREMRRFNQEADANFFTLQKSEQHHSGQLDSIKNFDFEINIQDGGDQINTVQPEPLISFRRDSTQIQATVASTVHVPIHTLQAPPQAAQIHSSHSFQNTATFIQPLSSMAELVSPNFKRILDAILSLDVARSEGYSAVESLCNDLDQVTLCAQPTVSKWVLRVVKVRGQTSLRDLIDEESRVNDKIFTELGELAYKFKNIGAKILAEQVQLLQEWAVCARTTSTSDTDDRKCGYLTPAPGSLTPYHPNSTETKRDTVREIDR